MESSLEVYLATVRAGEETGVMALLIGADPVVKLVLAVLIVMSIACWAVMLRKSLQLRAAARQSRKFLELFWNTSSLGSVYEQCGSFPRSPVAQMFVQAYKELARLNSAGHKKQALDNLPRTLRRAGAVQTTLLERGTTLLATTGSTGPFIGLFGTVWGILLAFQEIGLQGNASIQTVGPQISEALIVTAMGLATAIPAVIAYNSFSQRIRVLTTEMDNFADDFLNIVERHI